MIQQEWAGRIRALVKQYKPGPREGAFRNAYKAAVTDALAANTITAENAALLLKARGYVEAWASATPPSAVEAWAQWIELYEAGRNRLPAPVLEALLGRFPKSAASEVDWTPIVLGATDKSLVNFLLSRRLTRVVDLTRIAKANPQDFYRSAALDVLVERGLPCPRSVWDGFLKGERRPEELLEPEEAFVRSFDADRAADATRWLVRCLDQSAAVRKPILLNLLRNAKASLRVANFLLIPRLTGHGKQPKKAEDQSAALLRDWLAVCEDALGEEGSTERAASVVLGFLQIAEAVSPSDPRSENLAALSAVAQRISQRAILLTLRRAETDGERSARNFALIVRGDELYRAVQEYLRQLPIGAEAKWDSPERALRFERYMGQRDVLQGLLSALEDVQGDGPLRDAVEAALFNTGVRTYSAPGEEVTFDVHLHEPEAPGILPGSRVVVTRPGRRLGDEREGIVLIKARVTPR